MNDGKHMNRHFANPINQPVVPDQELPNGRISVLGYDPPTFGKQIKRTPRFDQLAYDSCRVELGISCDVVANLGEVIRC